MIIYKRKLLQPQFQDNLPTDALVAMSKKGSITTQLFIKWLHHFSKFKPPGKVLLLMEPLVTLTPTLWILLIIMK